MLPNLLSQIFSFSTDKPNEFASHQMKPNGKIIQSSNRIENYVKRKKNAFKLLDGVEKLCVGKFKPINYVFQADKLLSRECVAKKKLQHQQNDDNVNILTEHFIVWSKDVIFSVCCFHCEIRILRECKNTFEFGF